MSLFKLTITAVLVSSVAVASAQNTQNSGKTEEKLESKVIIAKPVANPTALKSVSKINANSKKVTPQKVNVTSRKVEALEPKKK